METRIVNIYKESYDVYMGRAGRGHDGYFGNPFPLEKGAPKGSTLPKFKEYFYDRVEKDPEFKRRVLELKGKILGCFCNDPKTCHVSIIVKYIENYENE